jgi:hypothetical protein
MWVGPLKHMPTLDNETADVTWFANMPQLYMPVFWARQEAGICAPSSSLILHTHSHICDAIPPIGIPQPDADEFTSKVYGALFLSDAALYRTLTFIHHYMVVQVNMI